MNQAIRSVRTHQRTIFLSSAKHQFGPLISRQITTMSSKQESEKGQNPKEKSGDALSNSFGEGYATRSDEEGFGGTAGGSQAGQKIKIDQEIHENHPAYDKTQGSEVKEKEKGRHQTNASS